MSHTPRLATQTLALSICSVSRAVMFIIEDPISSIFGDVGVPLELCVYRAVIVRLSLPCSCLQSCESSPYRRAAQGFVPIKRCLLVQSAERPFILVKRVLSVYARSASHKMVRSVFISSSDHTTRLGF
ncbi:hypothetical protein RRG08_055361 [Elysia crispata]|uniref:Uncharacterized protein n=1 Tax=Elysia crispata TaxID=231223 RepID=A0AAE1AQQ2_9GAST|nr:hypothetical protein RRG08_055361 [Elysia crispata]